MKAPIVKHLIDDQIVIEDASFTFTLAGNTFKDKDAGDTLTLSASCEDGSPLPEWLSFDEESGRFSGELGNDEVGTLCVQVTATDSEGLSASDTFDLVVENVNDAPEPTADLAAVREDVNLTASGNLLDNDIDVDEGSTLTVTTTGVFTGAYGSLTISEDGSYEYLLANDTLAVQSLREDDAFTEIFAYEITDGFDTASSTLTVTVSGLNDDPVPESDVAEITEGNTTPVTGNVLANDTDADTGAVLAVANAGVYSGSYGILTLEADGAYSYALNNDSAEVQLLAEGEMLFDSFAYEATDGLAVVPGDITIVVNGVNNVAVAEDDIDLAREDDVIIANGNVLTNDTGSMLTVTDAGIYEGIYGTLTLEADGSYTYALHSELIQNFNEETSVFDAFGYTVAAEGGDPAITDTGELVITVEGSNDAPVAVGDQDAVAEDGAVSAGGNVLTNDTDVDDGAVISVANAGSHAGTYGTLTLGSDGSYTYDLANDSLATQSLRGGQVVDDTFIYIASDGIASTEGTLTVEVTGANDAPVATGDAASAGEDGVTTTGGNVLGNDTDVDAGTVLSVANAGSYTGTYGTLLLATNGGYSYTLNNASTAVQSLAAGQTVTDVFSYTTVDDDATPLTDGALLTVSITGANDAPELDHPIADQSANAGGAFNFTVAANAFSDIDQGDVLSFEPTLADGSALPAWLSFNAVTRTFSGTPGVADAGTFAIRVIVTDQAGATATDEFQLTVTDNPQGVVLVGTRHDDILIGTEFDDVLLGLGGDDKLYGRGGNDLLVGGKGDDRLYGENGDDVLYGESGKDKLYGGAGDDRLDGGRGKDQLYGDAGDDVLAGGKGGDDLEGGLGNDLYIHGQFGGNDEIKETGGQDTLLFGDGITAGMVKLYRYKDDLLVDLSGPHGRVTIEDWFGSDSNKVERIEFANGTAWDVNYIRSHLQRGSAPKAGHDDDDDDDDDGHGDHDDHDHHHGTSGNDTLLWSSADTFDGGAGTDTLRVAGGNLDLTAVANTKIQDVEQIDLTGCGNNRLTLNMSDLLDISSTTNTLKVLGNAGDSVDIVGSFTVQGVAEGFRTYKVGTGILLVDTDIISVT